MTRLEGGGVNEMYGWAMTEDVRNEERIEEIETQVRSTNPTRPRQETINSRDRKPLLEHKAVQNITQLGENKGRFK